MFRASIWEQQAGGNWQLTVLPTLNPADPYTQRTPSFARSANFNGTVIVGQSPSADPIELSRAVVWQQKGGTWQAHDLGTLRSDNSGSSGARSISTDGKVIGGQSVRDSRGTRPALWQRSRGGNWQKAVDLGTLRSDNEGDGVVEALNLDGTVAAGKTVNDRSPNMFIADRAAVWQQTGGTWKATDLGTHRNDDSGSSVVQAINREGTVAAGSADTDTATVRHAAVWTQSGGTWQKAAVLEPIAGHKNSFAMALNGAGTVVGGYSEDSRRLSRPVVWQKDGDQWTQAVELGTPHPAGYGTVQAISADGKVALGSTRAPTSPFQATLWRLDYPDGSGFSQPINPDNTRTVLAKLGGSTMQLAEQQRQHLLDLNRPCLPVSGSLCYRADIDRHNDSGLGDTTAAVQLGYAITPAFSAGIGLNRSMDREAPYGYRRQSPNHGVSAFAQWQGGDWFVRGSLAHNRYRLQTVRPKLPGTEAGEGTSHMHGTAAQLAVGQQQKLNEGAWSWQAGLQHSRIHRNGYTETEAAFPITFGAVEYRDTALTAQAQIAQPIGGSGWGWHAGVQAEYSIAGKAPEYTASEFYIGSVSQRADLNRLRGSLHAGVDYRFTPQLGVSLTPYVGRNALGDSQAGVRLNVGGSF